MAQYNKLQVLTAMKETGIVPVFYHSDPAVAKQVLKACYDGGIRVFEYANRGDFAQGVFIPFGLTDDDDASGERTGGFGSTGRREASAMDAGFPRRQP